MIIWIEEQQTGERWIVHLGIWWVGFRKIDEAHAFMKTLQARIEAPHAWPTGDTRQRPDTVCGAPASLWVPAPASQ